ncbi:MAG: 5-formyltetrahydrofolate cyclo-ligase [Clostridia bacterium]|nr:5-formyltetrahydrofolate cyclo-ligase [Clostridia bacterium]MBQ4601961.1 5-formyltetrahydrofolate cyclo-ligase [Clostridia bacterium]
MNELRERKNKIREEFKALRRNMDPEVKTAYDRKICQRFMSLATYRFADSLLLYAPLKYEIDIMPIAEDALKKGKTVAFPRCNREEHTMTYYIVTDLSQLKEGYYGIREPDPCLPIYDPKQRQGENAVCFVPALAFDRKGYRVGYGKGFYDRYLSSFGGAKMGVEYSACVVDTLPRGRYDTAVDFLVTEKGVVTINAN